MPVHIVTQPTRSTVRLCAFCGLSFRVATRVTMLHNAQDLPVCAPVHHCQRAACQSAAQANMRQRARSLRYHLVEA